ncbi:MAG: thioesterase family protein [Acidimicrobiales bacterium]|nr:thioesterase family protein [Acidimicrobiales bacterium]
MTDALDLLLRALDLRQIGEDSFVGPGDIDNEYGIFGGHLLGQGVAAACRTAPVGRAIHSFHAYFIAGDSATGDIEYQVERIRDGGTFAHREVRARRGTKELFRMTASFQAAEAGLEWEAPPAHEADLPDPDSLPELPDLLAARETPVFDEYWTNRPRAVQLRYARAPWADAGPSGDSGIRVWWRTPRPIADDPHLHSAVAAFVADESISDNVLTPHGLTWTSQDLLVVSLDHAMWFHRPFRVDDWLLFVQRPLVTNAARGLALGHLYDREGRMVATCTQEVLVRQ